MCMSNNEYHKQWYSTNKKKRLIQIRRYNKLHKKKISRYQKKYRQVNQQKIKKYTKKWHIKRKYGLTESDVLLLLQKQCNRCPICGYRLLLKHVCVDHCHTSGKIRGLLHGKCNVLLGLTSDDVSILKRAIRYLKNSTN